MPDREQDPRERWVPGATQDDEDEQLRRLWRREPGQEREARREADEPRPSGAPDFGWWGPW